MSTISTYLQISNNAEKWRSITAAKPQVKLTTSYFEANITKVKSASDLIKNPRLFEYAMKAFGLGDMVYAKGLMTKVLEGGVADRKALANTITNSKIKAFAQAFDFKGQGTETTASTDLVSMVVDRYTESELQADQGKLNPGVQLAMYFQQRAPSIKNVYEILADKQLLSVVHTALGISPLTAAQKIDTQHAMLSKLVKVEDFSDPKKLQSFITKFAAMYDSQQADPMSANYSPGNTANAILYGAAMSGNDGVLGPDPALLLRAQSIRI